MFSYGQELIHVEIMFVIAQLWKVNKLLFCFSVYSLITRRKFTQMEVLENQNILVTISGKKNKIRVYYLSWLKSKIFKTEGVSSGIHKPCTTKRPILVGWLYWGLMPFYQLRSYYGGR